jgi:AAA family ATPase
VQSPCIVVLDELDAICPARSDTGGGGSEVEQRVVATLLTLLDGFSEDEDERVVVVATTNRPNAIDQALRRPGRLDREIEIGTHFLWRPRRDLGSDYRFSGFPDAAARTSILRVLLARTPHDLDAPDLASVAEQAHGYVGADLAAVVREAGTAAIKAWTTSSGADAEPPKLHAQDLRAALSHIRPSALRMFLATGADVPVKYSDIGGLGPTIQKLRECVEWPLRHPGVLRCFPFHRYASDSRSQRHSLAWASSHREGSSFTGRPDAAKPCSCVHSRMRAA